MSTQAALQFGSQVLATPALRKKLVEAVKGKEGLAAAQATVALAKPLGFDFTAEEALQARSVALALLKRESIARGETTDTELSDTELELVAGGTGKKPKSQVDSTVDGMVMVAGAAVAGQPGVGAAITISEMAVDQAYRDGNSPVNSNDIKQNMWEQTKDFFSDAFSGW